MMHSYVYKLTGEEYEKAKRDGWPEMDLEKYPYQEYIECMTCGYRELSSSREGPAEKEIVISNSFSIGHNFLCRRCIEVQNRAPEIYEWVLSVILHKEYLSKKLKEGEDG